MDYLNQIAVAYLVIGLLMVFVWPFRQFIAHTVRRMRFVDGAIARLGNSKPVAEWKFIALPILLGLACLIAWPVLFVSWYRNHR